ncbi:helix-turn-helix domain-containing protein [Acutalibacter muris]|uniref:helix-turn-helix domain-containing protein n=1 Tax=Acutalibacter muris TaxID=1796620 RepID=UPI00272E27FA|nr:XRE family transcriptional regulator [Acutalibacter muris]
MNTPFNGDRLRKARIYRGLTVAELAERVGCQRQTLSMYEISKSQPTDKTTVASLAQELDFPVKYFYEHSNAFASGTVYFRSLLTTNKKYRSEQIVKMDYLSQIYSLLQDYVAFPEYEPFDLPDNVTPEQAAYALRDAWGLGKGPVDNLVSVVEQHGILVTSFSTSTNDVDAFSQFMGAADTPTYIIAYSNNKTSAARIHFDIAHELGHICLHEWSEDIEDISKEEFKLKEREANDFAAAFLLPEVTFRKDAERGPQTITYYKQLKKKWRVSIAAMIRRSEKLGIISTDDYQNLIRVMQRRGLRKEEPLDDILITASPALLKTSVIMLLQENIFSPTEFMEELSRSYGLSINATEVEYLLDLPTGTLAIPRIIEFPSLQIKRNNN